MSTRSESPEHDLDRFEQTLSVPEGTARAKVDQLCKLGIVSIDRDEQLLVHRPSSERFRTNEAMTLYQLCWENARGAAETGWMDDAPGPIHCRLDPTPATTIHVGPVVEDDQLTGFVAIEGVDGTPRELLAPVSPSTADPPTPVPFGLAIEAALDRATALANHEPARP